jgi:hypothetical protein
MSVNPIIAGKKFGYLTTAYADFTGHRIACRCICSRLTFVAAADLMNGTIDSCGCQPASPAHHRQLADLSAQLNREMLFGIAKAR